MKAIKRVTNYLLVSLVFISMGIASSKADIVIKVGKPITSGSTTRIELEMENTFDEVIESARATVFLIDQQGKITGKAARWVIGGTKEKPNLAPGKKTTFQFVLLNGGPFITSRITFSRIVFEGGRVVDMSKSLDMLAK